MSTVEEILPALEPLRVAVVAFVTTPNTQAVVAELRRGAMQVELRTADVLDGPPLAPVYVIAVDPANALSVLPGRFSTTSKDDNRSP